jgi:Mg-chelatase subunit ChlD
MSRRENPFRRAIAHRVYTAAFLCSLSLGVTLLPLVSAAQGPTEEAPVIDPKTGAVTIAGYTLTPGNVDTEGWSEQNKSVLVNFSLDRSEERKFRELTVDDVKAGLNDEPVARRPDSLTRRAKEPVKVLFMIDRSGSMVASSASGGLDKLQAARESLSHILSKLDDNYMAAVVAFDVEQEDIVPLTGDKQILQRGVGGIVTRNKDTAFYHAIKYALDVARDNNIKNIVFLSDGKESNTPEAKAAEKGGRLESWKRDREKELGIATRQQGVPVYSIAIGDPNDASDSGVDYTSLKNISGASNGGTATLIDIPELNRQSGNNPARANERLTSKLTDVLNEIKKYWSFSYGVRVALPDLQEGEGVLKLDVHVQEGDRLIKLPMEFSYTWDRASGPPIFSRGRVLTPVFINIKPPFIWTSLVQIYFLLLSPLALLGLLPSLAYRVAAARDLRRMSNSIEWVRRGSPHVSRLCPNEGRAGGQRYAIKAGDTVLICPMCNTVHHLSCWEYNQHRCMNRVCEYEFVIPERVLSKFGVTAQPKGQIV